MDSLGLVIHDDQTYLTKVVNLGMDQGIFTRDRADEIIRISVAMANKYVLQKEIDFRSEDELAKVQENILKLVGVGLEIKSRRNVEEGVRLIMEMSPVSLFRLAYTRIEKLRSNWQRLLLEDRVEILVSSKEFQCLSDLTCQRLSEMSVFSESEIYTIRSITLDDELFSTLAMIEYYESEVQQYEFLLKLKGILPFKLLNKSPNVTAENLSEVDCIREALINTLVISAYVDAHDPISLKMEEIRIFLTRLEALEVKDQFPLDLEDVVIDVIQELGEGLDELEGSLWAKEMIRCTQKLLETITKEWDTVNSLSESIFFKRWCRLAILSDVPDSISRILSTPGVIDEFDFEAIVDRFSSCSEKEAFQLIDKLQWSMLTPGQVIQLFHLFRFYNNAFAQKVNLTACSNSELIDLLEGIDAGTFKILVPALKRVFSDRSFSIEELELLDALPHTDSVALLRMASLPSDHDLPHVLADFREGPDRVRRVIFYSCWESDLFSVLFSEAWASDPGFVKKLVKAVSFNDIGALLLSASGNMPPTLVGRLEDDYELKFASPAVNACFRSLPKRKKEAAFRFFQKKPHESA